MEVIRMMFANLDIFDVQVTIGVGLSYSRIAKDNLLWKNKLKSAFNIDRFPHHLEKDKSINWFHMYQKYRRQEVVLPDFITNENGQIVEKKMTSYVLPFPCVQVCDTDPSSVNSTTMFLSLDGKVYTKIPGQDFRILEPFKVRLKQLLVTDLLFGYFLSEDDEVYYFYYDTQRQFTVTKIKISFKVMEIQYLGSNNVTCIGFQRNLLYHHYVYFDENWDLQTRIGNYRYLHPLKKMVVVDNTVMYLTMNGNLYINGIQLVEYRRKIKDIIRIPGLTSAIIIDEDGGVFFINKMGIVTTLNFSLEIFNLYDLHCNRAGIYTQMYFDSITVTNSTEFYPKLSNNEVNPFVGLLGVVNFNGVKQIGNYYPKELKLKDEYEELDQTYRIFTGDYNYTLLSFGVIEVDFDYIQQLSPFLNDDGSLAPLYNVKTIGSKSYLYTRNKTGDMIRCRVSYDMGTGEISEYLEEKK